MRVIGDPILCIMMGTNELFLATSMYLEHVRHIFHMCWICYINVKCLGMAPFAQRAVPHVCHGFYPQCVQYSLREGLGSVLGRS